MQTVFYPKYKSFEYRIEYEYMDDNIKMYHYGYHAESNKWHYLAHSPYTTMSQQEFQLSIDFLLMAEQYELYNNQESEWDA